MTGAVHSRPSCLGFLCPPGEYSGGLRVQRVHQVQQLKHTTYVTQHRHQTNIYNIKSLHLL